DVRAENVRTPGDDEPGVPELLRLSRVANTQCRHGTCRACGCANSAVEPGRTETMEEAAVHARSLQKPQRAAVAVGQNGLRTKLLGDRLEPDRNSVERFIPGDALEAALALCPSAPLGIQQARGRIFALQILRYFAAQKPTRNGMIWIAAQLC